MKYFLIYFLLLLSLASVAQDNQTKYGTIYVNGKFDTLPEYPGGEFAMYEFITTNFRPNSRIRSDVGNSLQQLIITAKVDTNGSLSNFQIRECSSVNVEVEIVRVMKTMPEWKPAVKKGENAVSEIHIPYSFRLEGSFVSHNPVENPTFATGRTKKARFLKAILIVGTLGFFFLAFS